MVKKFSKVLVGSTAIALVLTGCGKATKPQTPTSPAAPAAQQQRCSTEERCNLQRHLCNRRSSYETSGSGFDCRLFQS